MIEKHGPGQYLRDGIGYALPGDVGCRAVHRLEHGDGSAFGIDISGCRQPESARDSRRQIGEDVAEEI